MMNKHFCPGTLNWKHREPTLAIGQIRQLAADY
jgi:hypothetical protein